MSTDTKEFKALRLQLDEPQTGSNSLRTQIALFRYVAQHARDFGEYKSLKGTVEKVLGHLGSQIDETKDDFDSEELRSTRGTWSTINNVEKFSDIFPVIGKRISALEELLLLREVKTFAREVGVAADANGAGVTTSADSPSRSTGTLHQASGGGAGAGR